MIDYKENIEQYKMARKFVAGRMTAVDFVNQYMDMQDKNPYGDEMAEISDDDYVKDTALLSSIYLHCDTHETMHGADGGYTDEELKIAVAVFLDADDVKSGYKTLRELGLNK